MQLQLEQLIERIDSAFGVELPFSGRSVTDEDRTSLQRVFGDEGYQSYLQDQVNRQIIRDYLTNAVVLGYLTVAELDVATPQVADAEGRASLSLHMLMSSVEDAQDLITRKKPEPLEQLKPETGTPPHIRLISS